MDDDAVTRAVGDLAEAVMLIDRATNRLRVTRLRETIVARTVDLMVAVLSVAREPSLLLAEVPPSGPAAVPAREHDWTKGTRNFAALAELIRRMRESRGLTSEEFATHVTACAIDRNKRASEDYDVAPPALMPALVAALESGTDSYWCYVAVHRFALLPLVAAALEVTHAERDAMNLCVGFVSSDIYSLLLASPHRWDEVRALLANPYPEGAKQVRNDLAARADKAIVDSFDAPSTEAK